jgi:hypothetical protein
VIALFGKLAPTLAAFGEAAEGSGAGTFNAFLDRIRVEVKTRR